MNRLEGRTHELWGLRREREARERGEKERREREARERGEKERREREARERGESERGEKKRRERGVGCRRRDAGRGGVAHLTLHRKVDIRLHGRGSPNRYGARPVHQNHLDEKVDSDQQVVTKKLSLSCIEVLDAARRDAARPPLAPATRMSGIDGSSRPCERLGFKV